MSADGLMPIDGERINNLRQDVHEAASFIFGMSTYGPMKYVVGSLYKIYVYLIVLPFYYLYLNGPSIGGILEYY